MKNRLIALLLALAAVTQWARSEPNQFSDPASSKAFSDVFLVDRAAFARDIAKVTDKAKAAYLREYMALMNYTAANSDENYEAYIDASDAAFDAAGGSKYEENLLCQLHIHKCMVYIYSGSLLSGGLQFWKSYRLFKEAEKKYPSYDGQMPLRGLYNILFAQIPEKWKSLKGLLGLGEGNTELGFRQIEQYRKKVEGVGGVGDEAVLFSFANMFFSHDQNLPGNLMDAIKANEAPVIRYAYILSCGRCQNGEAATASLDATSEAMMNRFPLLFHQKGKYALRREQPDEAIRWASRFVSVYRGVSNRNGAYLEMAYAYILKGDRAKARQMADKCGTYGSDFDIDRRAVDEASRAMSVSEPMLRARLQFEYGRFEKSLRTLKSFSPAKSDEAEYSFRMARAEDRLGDVAAAIKLYDSAIALSAGSRRYFGPYAAVHAADICLAHGDRRGAMAYLAKARQMNNGEYKKELDQRIELTERAAKKQK